MKRFLAVFALLAVLVVAGVWWRNHQQTTATLRTFGLVKEDPGAAPLQDSLELLKAEVAVLREAEARALVREQRADAVFRDAKAALREERRELLASVESARDALALRPDSSQVPALPSVSRVTVDSARLAGTLEACDGAIAACEARAAAATLRADTASARAEAADSAAALAERLATRADSGRLAAIDSAGRVLSTVKRRSLKRAALTVVAAIGSWELVRAALSLLLSPK